MIRDKNLPCLLGFGGLLLQNHHSLVRNKVADTDIEDFPDATCRPIQNLRDESVLLREMRLDQGHFLRRKDFGLPRPIDLERNSHWSSRGTTRVYDFSAQSKSFKDNLVELSRELQPPIPVRTGLVSWSMDLRQGMRQVDDIF